jgi:DNA processing protein
MHGLHPEPRVTTDDDAPSELLERVRLNMVSGVGPRIAQLLLERFSNAGAIFAATRDQLLAVDGVGPKLAAALLAARHVNHAREELDRARDMNIDVRSRGSPGYPRMLEEICDPPLVLYALGALLPRDELAVAIVGSRRSTLYGRQTAQRLAGALARRGVTIVSGLARGIDAAAHEGALAAGGRTIAVLGSGLGHIYPPEHKALAEQICASGSLLSEYPITQEPLGGLFPQRNRIISGISLGVVVVEASHRSGALHTARHANEQGRDVFAVPGRIDSLASQGCHDLIRDGATLVRGPDDILQAIGHLAAPVAQSDEVSVGSLRELALEAQERQILNLVTRDPVSIDEVLRASPLEASRVLATLTVLEMRSFVRRLPGGMIVRLA